MSETLDDTDATSPEPGRRRSAPGLVAVWSQAAPVCVPFRCVGDRFELGRDELEAAGIPDGRVSRSHLRVQRVDDGWRCTDRGSRNGTWVDGVRCEGAVERGGPTVIRVGHTLLVTVDDVVPFHAAAVHDGDELVAGPALRSVLTRAETFARAGATLLLQGPSGAGKEVVARAYHRAVGDAAAPLVGVNCAAIPRELAERLLFGARRGAFTGASDAGGLVQQADGGTLFLDEVAELDLPVQAKLLRVLEVGAVLPLGATQPVPVRFRLCSASHRDLREAVREGRFREDLYFRIGRPTLRVPPLTDRREEIGYHIARTLRTLGAAAPRSGVGFVEACLLRAWPGNVRELRAEVRAAALDALAEGRELDANALDPEAGRDLRAPPPAEPVGSPEEPGEPNVPTPPREVVWEALVHARGNVAQAAQRLGLSRARLRRLIERWSLEVEALRGA